jgi:hypothetical protein
MWSEQAGNWKSGDVILVAEKFPDPTQVVICISYAEMFICYEDINLKLFANMSKIKFYKKKLEISAANCCRR